MGMARAAPRANTTTQGTAGGGGAGTSWATTRSLGWTQRVSGHHITHTNHAVCQAVHVTGLKSALSCVDTPPPDSEQVCLIITWP